MYAKSFRMRVNEVEKGRVFQRKMIFSFWRGTSNFFTEFAKFQDS